MAAAVAAACLAAAPAPAAPPRVVSLDYCADQYVLALADPDQILGISTGPDDEYSALRDRAIGVNRVREAAENVLALEPDMVVRSYGGGPRAEGFYTRVGIAVQTLGFPSSFAEIRDQAINIAAVLGHPERGEALAERMDAELEQAGQGRRYRALYVTPAGITTGEGTMVHEILVAAGFENVAAQGGARGWLDLPLELLVLDPPELIVTGFFNMATNHVDNWSPTEHPAMRRQLAETPTIHLDGAWLACGAWFMASAALDARRQADALNLPEDGA